MVDKRFIVPDHSASAERAIFNITHELPHPGTQAWENMVDDMRADLESDMQHTKDAIAIEKVARELLKSQGRDFDAEFKKWKEELHG